MIAAFESELIKLRRPIVLFGAIGTMAAIAILATVLTFALAGGGSTFNSGRPGAVEVSATVLAQSSGWTRGFEIGAGFGGVVLLMVFALSIATEYSSGTLRSLLLSNPRRLEVLGGKLLGLIALVLIGFLVAEAASVVTALICAPLKGISVSSWFSPAGIRNLGAAYGYAALAGIGWGLFGAAVALVLRSVVPTLAVLLIWFFPFENIMQTRVSGSDQWFPGLLLQGLHADGASPVSFERTALTLGIYLLVAFVIAGRMFARRDVTV